MPSPVLRKPPESTGVYLLYTLETCEIGEKQGQWHEPATMCPLRIPGWVMGVGQIKYCLSLQKVT